MFWSPRATLAGCAIFMASISSSAAQPPRADDPFPRLDRNGDGKLSRDELPPPMQRLFERMDANKDGTVSREEEAAFRKNRPGGAGGGDRGLAENTRTFKNLRYVEKGHERHVLDLYIPAEPKSARPLVIWIHGGGWQNGSKENCPALSLTSQGFAVASINYRLSSHAPFPAQIQDCQAAVRWLRAHAAEYGLNPERFGVWGSSAGGHLVALVGTTGDVDKFEVLGGHRDVSHQVQAVCDWFGPTDFLQMDLQAGRTGRFGHNDANSPESKLVGGPITEHPDRVALANPVTYVSQADPPFLICHGDADNLVPLGQSELLETALKKAQVPVNLYVVQGGGHGGWSDPRPRELVEQFFKKQLQDQ